MISTSHVNAQFYFDRDVNSLIKFFKMKMKITIPEEEVPTFAQILKDQEEAEALALLEEEQLQLKQDDDGGLVTKVNNLMLSEEAEEDGEDVNNKDDGEDGEGAGGGGAAAAVPQKKPTTGKKSKKNKLSVKRRTRLDEVVKASGFISVKQDEQLLSFIEEQRVAIEEAIALGEVPERDEEDEDDDDGEGGGVLQEVENEEDEDAQPPIMIAAGKDVDKVVVNVKKTSKKSNSSSGVEVEDDRGEEEDDDEYEPRGKGSLLKELNPQNFIKLDKYGYNKQQQLTPNMNGVPLSEGGGGGDDDDDDDDSDEEDGSIRAGWTKEGGDSIISDVSTSTTSTHSRGYHGANFRPQRHRNKQSQPEAKRNSNKITYRGAKLHKPKA
jgi:hypothetical protein